MSFPSSWMSKFLDRLSLRMRAGTSRDRKRLLVERLEGRDLPASLTLASGVLTYAAAASVNNSLSVTVSGSNFVFTDTAETITTSVSGSSGSGTNTVNVPTATVTGITLNLNDGSDTIGSSGVVVNSTNTNLIVNALNALTLSGNVNTGTGTISLSANQDGAGTEGLSQNATAATSTITTTNTTASALAITVNTASGGTGSASLRTIAATGGTLAVQSFGGSILYAGTDTLTAFQAAQTTLAAGILGPQGNGGAVPTGSINAKVYSLSATGSGSIGTAARPIHAVSVASNSVTLAAGSGGAYFIDWFAGTTTLAGATATGAGNVVVASANASGHNLAVTGNVSTGSGNIVLAADDDFSAAAAVTIGGAGFSGAVYLAGNRDTGNTGNATMSGTITTSNTSASAVVIESFHAAANGTANGQATVNNVTVGNGGTIIVSTIPASLATGQGLLQMSNTSSVLNAGANGTVRLIAASVAGNSTHTNLIGSSATPIKVTAGNVVITAVAGSGATPVPNTPVFVTNTIGGNFTATTTGTGGNITLTTTSGALTIAGATNTANGTIALTGAAGVVLDATLGSGTTGAITVNGALSGGGSVATGTGVLTVTQTSDSTYAGNVTGTQNVVKVGAGDLTLTGTGHSFTGSTSVSAGTLTVNGQVTATSGVSVASGAILSGTGVVGALAVTGTVSPAATQGGVLGVGNLTFASGGTYDVQILGPTAGAGATGHDQLDVAGTVNLANAALNVTTVTASAIPTAVPLVIVKNDGAEAVSGTFTGLAEGATVTAGGVSFTLSYVGGDGNDVTLTRQPSGTFYVDDGFASLNVGDTITDADPVAAGDQSAVFGTTAFATVVSAIASANVQDFANIIVNAGTYSEAVVVSKPLTFNLQQGAISFGSLSDAATAQLSAVSLNGIAFSVGGDNSTTTFSGSITGSGSLTKLGSGTFTLAASNGYAGGTTVSAGTLAAAATNAFGTGRPLSVASGTTLQLGGFNQSFGNVAGAGMIANNSGTATLTVTTMADSTFTGPVTQTGSGVLRLVKGGSASLSLLGANAFTGSVTVSAGTLVLNGSAGSASVAAGATLAGSATAGATGVSGRLSPGTPGGTATFGTGNLSFPSGGILALDLLGPTLGSEYDRVSVTGTVSLTGATLQIVAPAGLKLGDRFVIISNDGTDAVTGVFANAPLTMRPAGSPYLFAVSTTGGDGNDVVLTVVGIRAEIDEDAAALTYDLSQLLAGSGVSYSVAQTNTAGLLTSSISDATLTLTPAANGFGYSYVRVTASNGSQSFTGYLEVIVRAIDDLAPDKIAAPTSGTVNVNVLANDGASDRLWLAEAGNLRVVQNDTGNNNASVTVTLPQSTPGLTLPPPLVATLPSRGDFIVQAGATYTDDLANGLFFSTSRENGRDNGEGTGADYATPAMDWDAGLNVTFLSINRAGDGGEWNEDQAVAYFTYAQGWMAAWVNNSAGTNGGANNRLFTSTPNGGFALAAGSIEDLGGGNTKVTIPGVNSQTDGVLLAIHAKNEDNYALARPNADGSWQLIVKDNGTNGVSTEQDPVAFVYVPRNMPNVVSGRILGDGSVQMASGNFTLSKTSTGTYTLTVPGQTPLTGVLMLSPERNEGTANQDNVVSYQASGSDFVIQTRDIIDAVADPTLEDVGASVPVASFVFIPMLNAPSPRLTSVQSPGGTPNVSALGAALTIDSDGTVKYDPSSISNYASMVADGTFGDSFTYTTTTLNGVTATTTVTIDPTLYVDDAWVGLSDGTAIPDADPVASGSQPAVVGATAFAGLSGALASTGKGPILVNAGAYDAAAIDEAADVTVQQSAAFAGLTGTSAGAVVRVLSGTSLTVDATASGTLAASLTGDGALTKAGTGTLTLTGANALTGGNTVSAGTLRIGDGGTTGSVTGAITDNASVIFDRSDAVTYAGAISGSGQVIQAGAGTLTLAASSSYSGGTVISRSTLRTSNASGVGTGTVTLGDSNTGSADVAFLASAIGLIFANNFVVSSEGTGAAVIGTAAGLTGAAATQWDGTLALNRGVTLQAGSSDRTSFAGVISGTGDVTITGTVATNRVTFAQSTSAANTFIGNVIVSSGTLELFGAATNQFIPDASDVTVASGATLRLSLAGGNSAETVGGLSGAGTAIAQDGAATDVYTLTVGGSDGDATFSGVLRDSSTGVLALVKAGTGTQTLGGANLYTGGTTVNAGTLLVANASGSGLGTGDATVAAGATLAGNGSFSGAAGVNGRLSPGVGTAILGTGALSFGSGGTLALDLNGTTAGTGYDQVQVTGAVNLNGATADVTAAVGLNAGDFFTVISNDGTDAVSGTFASGGTLLNVGGKYDFAIDYAGGDGNDVVFRITSVYNLSPVNTVPSGPLSVAEDTTLNVMGLSVSDPDALGAPIEVTLNVLHGTLSTDSTSGVSASGDGTATLVLTGTASDLNVALATLRYVPGANYAGDDTLTMTTDDQGNTGSDGAKTDEDTVALTVTPVNDAPTAADGTASTNEDTAVSIDLRPLVSDVETADADLIYEIVTAPPVGILAATATPGVYVFTPPTDFNGQTTFTYKVTDAGQGSSSALSAQASVTITVASVNDAPLFTLAGDVSVNQSSGAFGQSAFLTGKAAGPATAADEAGQTLTLDVSNDNNALFSTQPAIDPTTGQLTFTPATGRSGTATVTVTLMDDGGTARGGVDTTTKTFTVTVAAAGTPSATNASTVEDVQTASGLVITAGSANTTHYKVTNLVGGLLFLSDGTTPVTGGSFITRAQGAAGLKFTPDADKNAVNATFSLDVQASVNSDDTGLGGGVVTATIAVAPVADTPSATNAATSEDVQSTSGLVVSRSAVDGPEVTHFKITGVTNGTLFLNDGVTPIAGGSFVTFAQANAGLRFTPSANFFGAGSFQVQASLGASDAGLGGSVVTASITVTPVADTPSVTDSSTFRNVQSTTGLVVSRNAVDGDEVTHFKIANVTNGTLFLNDGVTPVANNAFITFAQANAGLKFTPATGFVGTGSFLVRASTSASDPGLGGAAVTATITVEIAPLTPGVTNATTTEDVQTTSGLVITNNSADTGLTTHYKITGIANGTLFLNDGVTPVASGSFITKAQGAAGLKFLPSANFYGNATFMIQGATDATDSDVGGSVVTATITVTPVADTPSATNATTNEDVQTTSGLVIARNAADGPEVSHFKITGITNGTLFLNDGTTPIVDGSFITASQAGAGLRFTPNANFFGSGSFQVQASLGASDAGLAGGLATATITVNPVADTPSVTNATTSEDVQSTSGLVVSRSAVDGPEVTHFKITGVTNGTLFLNDGVTPIAGGSFVTFAQANAGLRFTPNANFFGNGSFQVQASLSASDAGLGGSVVTATVAVTPVADTPSATNASTNEDAQTTNGLVITRNAADTAEVTHFKITSISNGTLFLADGTTPVANGSFITASQGGAGLKFTPDANKNSSNATLGFTVRASIGASDAGLGGAPAAAVVTVAAVNDEPTFSLASPNVAVNEDGGAFDGPGFVSNVQAGPTTDEVGSQTVSFNTSNNNSALFSAQPIVDANGRLTFTVAPNAFGTATVTVIATDSGPGASPNDNVSTRTFTITVSPLADTPTVTTAFADEDTQTTSGLVITRNPADGTEVSHYKIAAIGNGTLFQADGVTPIPLGSFITVAEGAAGLKFTPSANFNGTATFAIQAAIEASDAGLGGSPVTATILVVAVNDAPVANDDAFTGTRRAVLPVLANDGDVDGPQGPTIIAVTQGSAGGKATITADGVTYVPARGFSGTETFSYTVSDGLLTDVATVSVTIPSPPPVPPVVAVGTDAGIPTVVRLFDAATLTPLRELAPYAGYGGGVRVAQGDVNGDRVPDLITVTAGTVGHVKVFDGVTGAEIRSFLPFGNYPAGLYVTAGDLDDDGFAEIVVGLEAGPAHVKAFGGATGAESLSFIAYEGFSGGVRVAAGDLDGDGDADLATVAGPGGNGHIKAFDGRSLALIQSYLAYVNFDGDVQLTIAQRAAGGTIVTTAVNPSAGAHVRGTLVDGTSVLSFFAPQEFGGPSVTVREAVPSKSARVAALDLNKDGIDELLLVNGPGDPTRLLAQDGATMTELDLLFAFDLRFNRGAYVG